MHKLQCHAHCALKALRVLLLIGSFCNFFGSFLASDWSASTAIARALLFSREERCAFGMSPTEDGSRGGGGGWNPHLSHLRPLKMRICQVQKFLLKRKTVRECASSKAVANSPTKKQRKEVKDKQTDRLRLPNSFLPTPFYLASLLFMSHPSSLVICTRYFQDRV